MYRIRELETKQSLSSTEEIQLDMAKQFVEIYELDKDRVNVLNVLSTDAQKQAEVQEFTTSAAVRFLHVRQRYLFNIWIAHSGKRKSDYPEPYTNGDFVCHRPNVRDDANVL